MESLHDPADVARLASTCRSLRSAADAPPYGGTLWRSLAARVIGAAATALHDDGGPPSTAVWRAVVAGALSLDAVHWSRRSARALQDGVAEGEADADASTTTPPPLRRALARSGHTATDDALGRVIVTGGVRRDGGTSGALDVVVVDARSRSVARPRTVHGAPPPPRFRHAAVAVTPDECPAAADALVGVLVSIDGGDDGGAWGDAPRRAARHRLGLHPPPVRWLRRRRRRVWGGRHRRRVGGGRRRRLCARGLESGWRPPRAALPPHRDALCCALRRRPRRVVRW